MTKKNILKHTRRILNDVNTDNFIGPLIEAKQFLRSHIGEGAESFISELSDITYRQNVTQPKTVDSIREVLNSFIKYVENDLLETTVG